MDAVYIIALVTIGGLALFTWTTQKEYGICDEVLIAICKLCIMFIAFDTYLRGTDSQMENTPIMLILTFLTAAATFTTEIARVFLLSKKDTEKLDNIQSGVKENRDKSASEHDRLRTEHDKIISHVDRSREKIFLQVNEIRATQLEEKAVREAVSKTMPQETQLEFLVKDVFANNKMLHDEIAELKNELSKEKEKTKELEDKLLAEQEYSKKLVKRITKEADRER